MAEKPIEYTDQIAKYLNDLRGSGKINMFGAFIPLAKEFGLTREVAKLCFLYWSYTFRH
jgi:hypothetical protein